MDYITAEIINKTTSITSISGFELEQVIINGTLYRGDKHTNSLLRHKPAFFGDRESALTYMRKFDVSYLKYYSTKHPLKLLVLTNYEENCIRISKFFKEYLTKQTNNPTDIYITYIMMEIAYGLIPNVMNNLDLCGFDIPFIETYMRNVYKINNEAVIKFVEILNKYKDQSLAPTRISIREIDQSLINNLQRILKPYSFEGLWYDWYTVGTTMENLVCRRVNLDIFNKDTVRLTCVPGEMSIFVPDQSLRIIKIQERTSVNGEYKDINLNEALQHERQMKYKKKYHKYKKKYQRLKAMTHP